MPVLKIDQEPALSALVLACGNGAAIDRLPAVTDSADVELCPIPSKPGKADVDPRLAELGDRRLIVAGEDADLAAVVLRLLRTDRVKDVIVGFVPTRDDSEVAALWRLPADPGRAFDCAVRGEVDPIPLIRDDAGGVLVGVGTLGPVRGVAYCDDDTAMRGRASRIEVTPDPEGGSGLIAHVIRVGWLGRRANTLRGRAFQLGCLPTPVITDGSTHSRPVTRWTWYRHTEDLRAVRGSLNLT
jgi:hypothetical protein